MGFLYLLDIIDGLQVSSRACDTAEMVKFALSGASLTCPHRQLVEGLTLYRRGYKRSEPPGEDMSIEGQPALIQEESVPGRRETIQNVDASLR